MSEPASGLATNRACDRTEMLLSSIAIDGWLSTTPPTC